MSVPSALRPQSVSRRTLIKAGGTLLLSVLAPNLAGAAQILAVRVWPADDYTRVTLENDTELKVSHFLVKDPDRMVVEIEGLELNPTLKSLVAKIQSNDPYIQQVRVGQNRPGVVRLVFDLKEAIVPQVFTLQPVGNYRHRLIFDLYPVRQADPIAALIARGDLKTPGSAPGDVLPDGKSTGKSDAKPDGKLADGKFGDGKLADGRPDGKTEARADGKVDGKPDTRADTRADAKPDGKLPDNKFPDNKIPDSKPFDNKPPDNKPGELADGKPGSEASAPDSAANCCRPVQGKHGKHPQRMITIALDPGHGGEDPGAIGRGGSREKDVVLAIAKRLKAKIEEQPNMRVLLTRDADFFVPLHVRVQKARKVQADLFMSIHADAFVESSARGSSVFVLSEKGASSTAARWLANKENAADLIGGVNLKNQDSQLAGVLLDLSTTAQINDSLKLGKAVLNEIGGINRLHRGSVEEAGFAVLKAPDIPSILIETAFISNPEEEAKLTDDAYQDQMAHAVLKGIRRYFARNPPLAKNRTV
jgi:N-acetylmuramoyl-L-alanine amidase